MSAREGERDEAQAFRDALVAGVRLYGEARFWDAHEAWEGPWRTERDEARRVLLQGLIQLAAAMHKLLVMRNPESAARVLARAREKLAPYPATHEGLALGELRRVAEACARAIDALDGRFDPSGFDRALVPPVRLT